MLDIRGTPVAIGHAIQQAADGSVTLKAADAEVHNPGEGQSAKYESGGTKDNIGYWLDPQSWVEWTFRVSKPSAFDVAAEVGSQNDGAKFQVIVGNETLEGAAPNTGSWDTYTNVSLGRIMLNKPGTCRLEVRPVKQTWKPINLRSITLKPSARELTTRPAAGTRNPKYEARNPRQSHMTEIQMAKIRAGDWRRGGRSGRPLLLAFLISRFGFGARLGLRCSLVGLLATPMVFAAAVVAGSGEPVGAQPGTVVFQTDFETPAECDAWSRADVARWETGYQGTTSLCVTVPADRARGGNMIQVPLDLTPYRGCRLLFECLARAENVTKPSEPYLGVKFMLHYQSASTGPFWQNENGVFGTFDWRPLRFANTIAPDATGGQILLGLQDSSGTVWFDAIKVTVVKPHPPVRPQPPANPGPVFKGHDLPRLRGVMSPNTFRDEDLRVLGMEWKANVIRWQITRNWGRAGTDRDLQEYDRWFDSELADLDKVLEASLRYGLKVVVDMHSPPGGRHENMDLAIFHEQVYQDHYIALWKKIAQRYKGQQAVWGYDLVNEPVQNIPSPAGLADYLEAQVLAAKAIRPSIRTCRSSSQRASGIQPTDSANWNLLTCRT